jgi:hypothetical protein
MTDPRRDQLNQFLRSSLDQTIEDRIDRYLSVGCQWITADHHFAHASSECVCLFRDGYFTSCIMVAQAVSDGILKLVGERNDRQQAAKESKQAFAMRMQQEAIISQSFVESLSRIQGSFRNDFHHMNPPVASVDLASVAKQNIVDLATIEREIFECSIGPGGTLLPKNMKYWDLQSDNSVRVYVRL